MMNEPKSTSGTTQPSRADPAGGQERNRASAGVITARVLAVLVVIMVIASIVGFIIFDRQGGNSAMAVASLAIGGAAAVLGLLLGFLKAYLTG
jgi:hypothetical protein